MASVWVYPVKSCRGFTVEGVRFGARGPEGDRRFAVVDAGGRFVSQRSMPRMTRIRPRPLAGGGVRLEAEGAAPFEVRPERGWPPLEVAVWNDRLRAVDCGAAAARWLSEFLERPVRLAWLPDDGPRVRPDGSLRPAAFADAEPVLVITESSLAELEREAGRPVGAERFRPNVVVGGVPAWEEDAWRRIRVGWAVLEIVKPCARCPIVAVDPETGRRDPAALRALGRIRRWDGEVWFGQNARVVAAGEVRAGDRVEILETAAGG